MDFVYMRKAAPGKSHPAHACSTDKDHCGHVLVGKHSHVLLLPEHCATKEENCVPHTWKGVMPPEKCACASLSKTSKIPCVSKNEHLSPSKIFI